MLGEKDKINSMDFIFQLNSLLSVGSSQFNSDHEGIIPNRLGRITMMPSHHKEYQALLNSPGFSKLNLDRPHELPMISKKPGSKDILIAASRLSHFYIKNKLNRFSPGVIRVYSKRKEHSSVVTLTDSRLRSKKSYLSYSLTKQSSAIIRKSRAPLHYTEKKVSTNSAERPLDNERRLQGISYKGGWEF